MSLATRHVSCDLVFLDQRGGVRNTAVIEVFAGMWIDPALGPPKTIYCDDGSENLFTDFLDEAMQRDIPMHTASSGRPPAREPLDARPSTS